MGGDPMNGSWLIDEHGMPAFYPDEYVRAAYRRQLRKIAWRNLNQFVGWVTREITPLAKPGHIDPK